MSTAQWWLLLAMVAATLGTAVLMWVLERLTDLVCALAEQAERLVAAWRQIQGFVEDAPAWDEPVPYVPTGPVGRTPLFSVSQVDR